MRLKIRNTKVTDHLNLFFPFGIIYDYSGAVLDKRYSNQEEAAQKISEVGE
jgi:hypothetical protein